jgi:hypothetical protein
MKNHSARLSLILSPIETSAAKAEQAEADPEPTLAQAS